MKGKVYLVGAGPGDPKLITIRGLEALRRSDAIVYDRLANPRLLQEAAPGAERIYVGKLPDRHTMPQEEINRLLVELALSGKTVTRLKGGDPCVFGRGGEEAEALAANGIEFEIIPGVTSATAVPAYAGIPVTHRDYNSAFAVITGHEKPEKLDSMIAWNQVARLNGTLVFLMGVSKVEMIAGQLMKHGLDPATPVALVRWGTLADQATLTGTLADIAEKVRQANFQPPAVIVVGEVVRLRDRLMWVEKKPLFGRRVLVTRARDQARELCERIDELGGEAVLLPVIRIRPPRDPEVLRQLDAALRDLESFDWVVFTSVNGVETFFERLRLLKVDIRSMHRARIAAVGPKTREALEQRGLYPEEMPGDYRAEGLLEVMRPRLVPGERILLAKGDLARSILPDTLRGWGMQVTEAVTYENVLSDEYADEVIPMLKRSEIDVITFTSPSTVRNLLEVIRNRGEPDPVKVIGDAKIACIGPVTAETAHKSGLKVHYLARESTVDSLLEAIIEGERQQT